MNYEGPFLSCKTWKAKHTERRTRLTASNSQLTASRITQEDRTALPEVEDLVIVHEFWIARGASSWKRQSCCNDRAVIERQKKYRLGYNRRKNDRGVSGGNTLRRYSLKPLQPMESRVGKESMIPAQA